jgi:hypothetical protein
VIPALALATFFGTFTVMSLRMGAGQDPALGAGQSATAPAQPRRVLVRRIVKKTVILPPREQPVAASAGVAPATGAGAPAPAAAPSGGAPAAASPPPAAAPAPAAPAPAPAPAAPAPAPATRAS